MRGRMNGKKDEAGIGEGEDGQRVIG